MNRERAETYLRQLAEAELRRARTWPAARIPGRRNTARLTLVAQALLATVTRKATSPGELLLDVIAARILTSAAASPQDNAGQPAAANAHLRVCLPRAR